MENTNKSLICLERIDKDPVEQVMFDFLSSPESLLKEYHKKYIVKHENLPSKTTPLDFKVALILYKSFSCSHAVIVNDYLYFVVLGFIIVLSPENTVKVIKPFRRLDSSNWSACGYDGKCYILIPQSELKDDTPLQLHYREDGFDIIDQGRTVPVLLTLESGEIVDQRSLPSLGVAPAQFYPKITSQTDRLVIATNNSVHFFKDFEQSSEIITLRSPITSICSFQNITVLTTQGGIVELYEGSIPVATQESLEFKPTFFQRITDVIPPTIIVDSSVVFSGKKQLNIVLRDSEGVLFYFNYNKLDKKLLFVSSEKTRYTSMPIKNSPEVSVSAPFVIKFNKVKSPISQSPYTNIISYQTKTEIPNGTLYFELEDTDFKPLWSLLSVSATLTYSNLVFSVEEIHPITTYDKFIALGSDINSEKVNRIFKRPILNSQLMIESLHFLVIKQHLDNNSFSDEDYTRFLHLKEDKQETIRNMLIEAMRESRPLDITQDNIRQIFSTSDELTALFTIESSMNTLVKNILFILDNNLASITIAPTLLVQRAPILISLDSWAKKFSPNNVSIDDLISLFMKLGGEITKSPINVRESVLGIKIPNDILLKKFAEFMTKYSVADCRDSMVKISIDSYLSAHTPVCLFDSLNRTIPIVSQIYKKPQNSLECNHVILLWTHFLYPQNVPAPTRPLSSDEFQVCLRFLGYLPKHVNDLFMYATTENDMRSSLFRVLVSHKYFAESFEDPLYQMNWKLVKKGFSHNLSTVTVESLSDFIDSYLEFIHFKTSEMNGLIEVLNLLDGSVRDKLYALLKAAYKLESIPIVDCAINSSFVTDGWIIDDYVMHLDELKVMTKDVSAETITEAYRKDMVEDNSDFSGVVRKANFIVALHQKLDIDSSMFDAMTYMPSLANILLVERPSYQLFVFLLSKDYSIYFKNIVSVLACFCLDDDITCLKLSILCCAFLKNDKFAYEHIQQTSPGTIYDLLTEELSDFELNILSDAMDVDMFSWNTVLIDITDKLNFPMLKFMLTGENTLKFDSHKIHYLSAQTLLNAEESVKFTTNQLFLFLRETILENDDDSVFNSLINLFQKCRNIDPNQANQAFNMLCNYAVAVCNPQLVNFCTKLATSINMNGVLKIDVLKVRQILKSISKVNGSLIPPHFDQLSVSLRMSTDFLLTQDENENKKLKHALELMQSLMDISKLFIPVTYKLGEFVSSPCEIHFTRLSDFADKTPENFEVPSPDDIDSYQLGLGFAALFRYFANNDQSESAMNCARYARLKSVALSPQTPNELFTVATYDDSYMISAVERLNTLLPEEERNVEWLLNDKGATMVCKDVRLAPQFLVKLSLTKTSLVKLRIQWLLIHLSKIKTITKNKPADDPAEMSFDSKKFSESIKKTRGIKKIIGWL